MAILSYRSLASWMLGYPEAALADAEQAVKEYRENGQAATLMYALLHVSVPYIHCGNYQIATAVINEVAALADEKGSLALEATRYSANEVASSPDRQSLERNPNAHYWDRHISVNSLRHRGYQSASAFWRWHTRNSATPMMLGITSPKR